MSKYFIAADHRGNDLKQAIVQHFKNSDTPIIDCCDNLYDPNNDFPDVVSCLIQHMDLQNDLGILLCGSGIGVSIVANKYNGVLCGLGFKIEQVEAGRVDDHINILALPADFIESKQEAFNLIATFIHAKPSFAVRHIRRLRKIQSVETLR